MPHWRWLISVASVRCGFDWCCFGRAIFSGRVCLPSCRAIYCCRFVEMLQLPSSIGFCDAKVVGSGEGPPPHSTSGIDRSGREHHRSGSGAASDSPLLLGSYQSEFGFVALNNDSKWLWSSASLIPLSLLCSVHHSLNPPCLCCARLGHRHTPLHVCLRARDCLISDTGPGLVCSFPRLSSRRSCWGGFERATGSSGF